MVGTREQATGTRGRKTGTEGKAADGPKANRLHGNQLIQVGEEHALRLGEPTGRRWAWSQRNSGEDVLAYAGIFRDSREESARIMETIGRDCRQVRKQDWREGDDRG